MNIVLWIVQILLALHTVVGAIWKFSKTAQETMPSIGVIPNSMWMFMAVVEIICAIILVAPLIKKSWSKYVPAAASLIATEMLMFCGLHLYSGATEMAPLAYWLIVAVICAFVSYSRWKPRPIR